MILTQLDSNHVRVTSLLSKGWRAIDAQYSSGGEAPERQECDEVLRIAQEVE